MSRELTEGQIAMRIIIGIVVVIAAVIASLMIGIPYYNVWQQRLAGEAELAHGDSLKGNESYLRYLWITSLEHVGDKTVVYVPTESNLPILEAHRFGEHSK